MVTMVDIDKYEEQLWNRMTPLISYHDLLKMKNVKHCVLCLDRDGVWKRLELKWALAFFENINDNKKADKIKNIMKKHYIADDKIQKKLNIELKKYHKKSPEIQKGFFQTSYDKDEKGMLYVYWDHQIKIYVK
jgi:hypothetical protein